MQIRKFTSALALVSALAVPGASLVAPAPAGAAQPPLGHAAAMHVKHVKEHGVFVKSLSKTAFKMTAGMKSYTVKVDAMTHVTLNSKKASLSVLRMLKKGDHLTVVGELAMGKVVAVSVTASTGM